MLFTRRCTNAWSCSLSDHIGPPTWNLKPHSEQFDPTADATDGVYLKFSPTTPNVRLHAVVQLSLIKECNSWESSWNDVICASRHNPATVPWPSRALQEGHALISLRPYPCILRWGQNSKWSSDETCMARSQPTPVKMVSSRCDAHCGHLRWRCNTPDGTYVGVGVGVVRVWLNQWTHKKDLYSPKLKNSPVRAEVV